MPLVGLGLSTKEVRGLLAAGYLHRVHRGVYAVGRPPVVPLERAAAAVLACGEHAALSHTAALTLLGLAEHWPTPLVVTVVAGDRRPPGIAVHRSRTLRRSDLTVRMGIRVTCAARTLLDCAPQLARPTLSRAVNDARRAGLARPAQLADVIRRNPTHSGAPLLRYFAGSMRGPTRSEFEDRFGALCERFDLPFPVFSASVSGYEVDAYFPDERLIVELDGWDFHQDRSVFESDRERDAAHLADGVPTLRITWDRLVETPEREAVRLRTILRRSPRA